MSSGRPSRSPTADRRLRHRVRTAPPLQPAGTSTFPDGSVATGAQETEVRVLIASSREEQPQLSVRMGGVTVHVGDRQALSSFVDAWRQAAELADTAFGLPGSAAGHGAPRTDAEHRSA